MACEAWWEVLAISVKIFTSRPSPNTPRTWLSTTLEHHFDMLLCFLLLTRSTGPHHLVEVSVIDGEYPRNCDTNGCLKAWFDEPKPGDFDDDIMTAQDDDNGIEESMIGLEATIAAFDGHGSEPGEDNIKIVDGEVELIDE